MQLLTGKLVNESPKGSSSLTDFPETPATAGCPGSLGVMRSICVMPRCKELNSCSKSTKSATDSGDI